MKRERIGAIDVGTTKVCTIMADIYDEEGCASWGSALSHHTVSIRAW